LDAAKIEPAQKARKAKTETETIDRALDGHRVGHHRAEKNRLVREASVLTAHARDFAEVGGIAPAGAGTGVGLTVD
jgi:hypothetical protein